MDRLVLQEASEFIRQLLRGGVAGGWLLGQALQADRFQIARERWIEHARRNRLLFHHQLHRFQWRRGGEGRPAGETFVENRAQRIHVAARAHLGVFAPRLLRRHVVGRAEHRACKGQFRVGVQQLGQAEVGDVRFVLCVEEDVRGLEIAVQHTVLVRKVNRLGHRPHTLRGTLRGEWSLAQPRTQAAARHEVHAVEVMPLVLTDFMDGHDAGMLQARRRCRLGAKARDVLGPRQRAGADEFDRHQPVQAALAGLINDAHTAPPDLGK